MEAFFELYGDLPRQGPGSEAATRRALDMLPSLPQSPRILDLGCGSGSQSLVLAEQMGGTVVAVDQHAPYLRDLEDRARRAGILARIETRCASMDALEDPPAVYDLVWSEGAFYSIGVERGLEVSSKLLKPGGLLAFTEITWLVASPPPEVLAFWSSEYPAMTTREANEQQAERAGFERLGGFVLPADDWRREYYAALAKRIEMLRDEACSRQDLAEVISSTEREIEMFERHGTTYGYVFYLLRKPSTDAYPERLN